MVLYKLRRRINRLNLDPSPTSELVKIKMRNRNSRVARLIISAPRSGFAPSILRNADVGENPSEHRCADSVGVCDAALRG